MNSNTQKAFQETRKESRHSRPFAFLPPGSDVHYWSESLYHMLELDPGITANFELMLSVIHEEDRQRVLEQYQQLLDANNNQPILRFRAMCSSGKVKYVTAMLQIEQIGNGQGLLAVFEFADSYRSNALSIDQLTRKQSLSEFFAGIGYWEYTPDADHMVWSDQVYRMLGVPLEQSISFESYSESCFPEDLETFENTVAGLSPESPKFQYTARHIVNDQLFVGLSRGTSIWDGDRMVKLIGSFEDITYEHQSKEKLRIIQETTHVGWYEINLFDKRYSLASTQYLRMHGLEYLGRMPSLNELLSVVHPEDYEKIVEARNKLYAEYKDWEPFEYRVILDNGTIRHIQSSGQVTRSPFDKRPFKVLGIIRDITDFQEKKSQLIRAQKLAKIGWYEHDMRTLENKISQEFLDIHELKVFSDNALRHKIHPDDRKELDKISQEYRNYQSGYSFTYRIVLESGDYRYIQNIGQYESDPATGELAKVMGTVQDITQFKMLEEKLQEAQRISNTGWFEFDILHPQLSSFSEQWLDMHCFEEKPKHLDEFLNKLHPVDRNLIPSLDKFLYGMPSEWNGLEYTILDQYGFKRHISNNARVIHVDGKPVKIFGTTKDITQTKMTERALLESERKYRLISENSRDAILLLESKRDQMLISFASDYSEDLSGYTKHELLGMEATQLMHREDRVWFTKDVLPKLVFGEEDMTISFRLFCKDGSFRWVEAAISVILEEVPVKLQLSVRDISDRKQYEQQLIRSNNDLNAMIKASDNIVFTITKDRRFEAVICNDEQKLHQPIDQFIGKEIGKIWDDETGMILCKMVHRAITLGVSEQYDYPYTIKGQFNWYRAKVHPFMGYDHQLRVSVVIETITTEKRAEEELKRTVEMERELSRMRASFVSMASHQFRTPLTVIKSNMQLLEASGRQDALSQKVSRRLTKEVDRLVSLMEDILVLGKVQSGAIQKRSKPTNLVTLVKSLKRDVDLAQTDGRELLISKAGEPVSLMLDEGLMRQAILNLVTNAFKYSMKRPSPKLTLDYTQPDFVYLKVEDYGMGIDQENLSRIFKDFFRSERVADIPGTGLGLSVTSEFLKVNGCTVDVKSTLNEGSAFTITIPRNE